MGTEILPTQSPNWPYRAASHWITSNHVVSYLQYCSACQPTLFKFHTLYILYHAMDIFINVPSTARPPELAVQSVLFEASWQFQDGHFQVISNQFS